MEYPLKQYGCDRCGELSDILEVDAPLPEGWFITAPMSEAASRFTHLCPACARLLGADSI